MVVIVSAGVGTMTGSIRRVFEVKGHLSTKR
jgi:hypothetical protein